ncbi:MAG: hypothetical protein IMZ50_06575 [Candidatus Atribacteria bacterium]|nr:hypothetical protein [Candidatus Atribacteria bacterium]
MRNSGQGAEQGMWLPNWRWGVGSVLLAVGAEAATAAGLVVIDDQASIYHWLWPLLAGWPVVYVLTWASAFALSIIARSRVLSEAVPGGHRFYPAFVLRMVLDWFLATVPGVLLVVVPAGAFLMALLVLMCSGR